MRYGAAEGCLVPMKIARIYPRIVGRQEVSAAVLRDSDTKTELRH